MDSPGGRRARGPSVSLLFGNGRPPAAMGVLVYGDPRHLRAMAAVLEREAAATRLRARLLQGAADTARWQSTAADAMRGRAAGVARSLLGVAALYERAHDDLLAHARAVEERVAMIEAVEARIRHLVERAGQDALQQAATLTLPPSGHAAWLDLADRLARGGALR